jgi:hypothetical protein
MADGFYEARCPHCYTPSLFHKGEQLEDCCDGATLSRARRLAEAGDFTGLLEALDVTPVRPFPWSLK